MLSVIYSKILLWTAQVILRSFANYLCRPFRISVTGITECPWMAAFINCQLGVCHQAKISSSPSGCCIKMIPAALYICQIPPMMMVWKSRIPCNHNIRNPRPCKQAACEPIISITIAIAIAQGAERRTFPAFPTIIIHITHMGLYITVNVTAQNFCQRFSK